MTADADVTPSRPAPAAAQIPRWVVPLLLLVAAAAVAGAWYLKHDPGPRPIVETTLETSPLMKFLSGGRNWRNLDFTLNSAEREDLALCLRLAGDVRATTDGVSAFAADSARADLEGVLARRPDFFYAEYLLGLWHAMRGDAARSRDYHERALSHAPVVLVQRYEFADGRPLAGATVGTFQVECNRVRNGSLDPSLKLTFFDLTTDAHGEIRVPVYDTVYRLFNMSFPEGHGATYPRLGWFASPGPVGLLPTATVRAEGRP